MRRALVPALVAAALLAAGCGGSNSDSGSKKSGGSSGSSGGSSQQASDGKTLFASTCGSCHTLKAAGTSGSFGPNLDELKPDEKTVRNQIRHGGGGMPAGLLDGKDADTVAAYVASNAGAG
jgi:mono/diheme cytochrome c family protein